MKFKNKENGYVESKAAPWFWVLLIGALYYIANGIWSMAATWIIVANLIGIFIILDSPRIGLGAAFFAGIITNIAFAVTANSSVRSHYLRKGWVEIIDENENDEQANQQSGTTDRSYKKCQYCAEEVLIKAIKCKHCGSDISTPPTTQ